MTSGLLTALQPAPQPMAQFYISWIIFLILLSVVTGNSMNSQTHENENITVISVYYTTKNVEWS